MKISDLGNMPVSELMHGIESSAEQELYHFGVKGMRWGHRKRVDQVGVTNAGRKSQQAYQDYQSAKSAYKEARKAERQSPEAKAARAKRAKTAAILGASAVGGILVGVGAYKLNKWVKSTNCKIAAERGHNFANEVFRGNVKSTDALYTAGKLKSATVSSGASKMSQIYANRASKDNFRTAAKNVINYRRGGGSLSSLRSVSDWANMPDQFVEWRRRGLFR